MLITIKNGGSANKESVLIPYSKHKHAIAKALLDAGYIESFEKKERKESQDVLKVVLRYKDAEKTKHAITNLKRISKPSRRLYIAAKNIQKVKDGFGRVFLSTPKGVLTGEEAKNQLVGGEILFQIW